MHTLDARERESILRDLSSGDDEVRRLAVERAVTLEPEEALSRLVDRLGDESWRVRKAAVERLSAWRDVGAATERLAGALADGDNPGRRNAAVEALVRIGRAAVAPVMAKLDTPDIDVRKFLVDVLAGIGDGLAVPALVALLGDRAEDVNVRAASADALGAIGGERAVQALLAAAGDGRQDPLVRFSTLHALAGLEVVVPTRALAGALADPVLRPAALCVLGCADAESEAEAVLLEALEDRGRASREAAMRALVRWIGARPGADAEPLVARIREVGARVPELLRAAIERLPDADLPTRLVLVQFLGVLRRHEAALPLLAAGADEAVRPLALAALAALGEPAEEAIDAAWSELDTRARRDACAVFACASGARSARRLCAAIEEADPEVRMQAARAIGARGLEDGLPGLVRRLALSAEEDPLDGDEERLAVSEALIDLTGPERCPDPARTDRAIHLLTATLAGADEPVRVAIARVLGGIGRHHHHELLGMLLKDASAPVRRAAVDALTRLGADTAIEALHLAIADESVDVRVAVAAALGARGDEGVVVDLCRLAADPDARVRAAAVRELGLHFAGGPAGASPAVDTALAAACTDEARVALAFVEAARETGGPAVARVVRLLERPEPEVVREAVCCLGRHAGAGDLEVVIPLTGHPDWSVRSQAISVLGERGVRRALPSILRRLDLEQDEFVRTATLRALERLEG